MLIQTKIQIDEEDYWFIKEIHKKLDYKSQTEYMRKAIRDKVKADRIRMREMKRKQAMEMIGKKRRNTKISVIDGDL
jgi:hypothetical protein